MRTRTALAPDTGKASDGARTWIYHLKNGVKSEDGTPITSRDVKWGVERSFVPELPGGSLYLRDWLVGGESYKGPYQGKELADWPAGGTFLAPVFDGRQILKDDNVNTAQLDDPKINAEFDAISEITDPTRARPRWGALDAELGRRALIVPLIHPTRTRLFGTNVRNAYLDQWRGAYDPTMVSVG